MSLIDRLQAFPESMISPPVEGFDGSSVEASEQVAATQQTYIGREGSVRHNPIDYSKKLPEDLAYIGRGDVTAAYAQGSRDTAARITRAVVAMALEVGVDVQSIVDNEIKLQKERG